MLRGCSSLMFLWKHERSLLPKQAKALGLTRITCELPISVPVCRSQLPVLELCLCEKGNRKVQPNLYNLLQSIHEMLLSLFTEVIHPKTLVCGVAGLFSIISFDSKTLSKIRKGLEQLPCKECVQVGVWGFNKLQTLLPYRTSQEM